MPGLVHVTYGQTGASKTTNRDLHHEIDFAVERCYRAKPSISDEEHLEYLFKLREKMIEIEIRGDLL